MTVFWIASRELGSYFRRPIAYMVISAFLLMTGLYTFVLTPFFVVGKASLVSFFEFSPFLFTLFIPAITMKSIAEERSSGMIEILQTWPVSDMSWVLGKFLGAYLLVSFAIVLTFIFPMCIAPFGAIDWGAVIGGYIGLFLLGAAYTALGLFASAWTSNQIIAFILGFSLCFAFFIVGRSSVFLEGDLRLVAEFLSFEKRISAISRGVLDTRDLIFFMTIVGAALGLSTERLHLRRWR